MYFVRGFRDLGCIDHPCNELLMILIYCNDSYLDRLWKIGLSEVAVLRYVFIRDCFSASSFFSIVELNIVDGARLCWFDKPAGFLDHDAISRI